MLGAKLEAIAVFHHRLSFGYRDRLRFGEFYLAGFEIDFGLNIAGGPGDQPGKEASLCGGIYGYSKSRQDAGARMAFRETREFKTVDDQHWAGYLPGVGCRKRKLPE